MRFLLLLVVLITVLFASPTALSQQIDRGLQGFWTLNVEKSDFGGRPKPKTGQVNWGEHGWTFAIVTADGRLYADGVATDHGCTLIGRSPNYSCEVEVVTPRHVRFTLREGATVRRIGDIELLENGTTQTTHRVTPPEGAPYVEKTIWEKPAENDTATRGVQSPSQQTSEEAAVRKLSELQFHQGHDLACLAGAHETGDSKQGAFVSLVKFDPGCIIHWHWHTPNENVMVVDGTLLQEWKDHPSSVAKHGDFIHIPSHQINRVKCISDSPCMIYLYTDAVFDMHYVDSAGREISVKEAMAASWP